VSPLLEVIDGKQDEKEMEIKADNTSKDETRKESRQKRKTKSVDGE
jgi:hypothetical protein